MKAKDCLARMDNMIDQFLEYLCHERNRSENTVESYAEALNAFEAYFKRLDTQLSWTSVDADVIRDWMESLMEKGNMSSTVCVRVSAVRSFFRFALSRHLVVRDPSRLVLSPKKSHPLPQFVKEAEMNRLLDQVEWGTNYNDILSRAVIVTFYETGIRLSELTSLNIGDVDLSDNHLKVTGKGSKQRIVPFGKELHDTLSGYLDKRSRLTALDGAFFLSRKGRRLSNPWVRQMVHDRLALVTTIKKKSPHVLRHSYATALLNHDADIESVKRLLGHESVATTEIYTHTTFEQLKRVYKNAHPRA